MSIKSYCWSSIRDGHLYTGGGGGGRQSGPFQKGRVHKHTPIPMASTVLHSGMLPNVIWFHFCLSCLALKWGQTGCLQATVRLSSLSRAAWLGAGQVVRSWPMIRRETWAAGEPLSDWSAAIRCTADSDTWETPVGWEEKGKVRLGHKWCIR